MVTRKSIVIIEDEEDLLELVSFNLQREGYQVSCATSGEAGLEKVKKERPDLVLLDLMLPNMDGLEVCKLLKANENTEHIPVMMITARGEDSDVVTGLEIGADDYLVKPFSVRVLVARVRTLLRRSRTQAVDGESPISVHDFFIHPGRHEVLVDGQAVNLSLTEFRILHLLAKSPGWVFSRYQIVNEVRGDDNIVTDRSVDVHIAGLRKKLGDFGKYVQTVHGVGYRFRE